jgi:hypothetical protein
LQQEVRADACRNASGEVGRFESEYFHGDDRIMQKKWYEVGGRDIIGVSRKEITILYGRYL